MQQRDCQVQAAHHTAGVRRDAIVAAVLQPDEMKQLLDATFELRSPDVIDATEETDILGRGQWVQCDFLGRYAYHLTNRSPFVADTMAQYQSVAGRRTPLCGKH
jgi:hypothetical protein